LLLEFDIEQNEIYHIERMAKDKQRLIDREERKVKLIEERKQRLKDRPNPFEKEIDTCEHLIATCTKLKVRHGLMEEREATVIEVEKVILSQFAKEDVAKKV